VIWGHKALMRVDETTGQISYATPGDVLNAGSAAELPFTPFGCLLAANVQSAIEELEKKVSAGLFNGNFTVINGDLEVRKNACGAHMRMDGYSDNTTGQVLRASKARGTYAAPAAVQSGDNLAGFLARGYGATGHRNAGEFNFQAIAPAPSDTDMQGRFRVLLSPAGSVTLSPALQVDHTLGLHLFSGVVRVPVLTVATLPVGAPGMRSHVGDALAPAWGQPIAGGGAVSCPVYFDNAWRAG
jgi:hypothetical protein